MDIAIKRVFEPRARADGYRVLVDRVWPRGVSKEAAEVDLWLKEVAPSTELRTWFSHDPERWREFRTRYFKELAQHRELLEPLTDRAKHGRVTLVYGAKEERFNNAVALKSYLERKSLL